jgi:hypothetical protein
MSLFPEEIVHIVRFYEGNRDEYADMQACIKLFRLIVYLTGLNTVTPY